MKIEPINIAIADDKKYLDVALLVDQHYFLKLVAKTRLTLSSKYHIQTPLQYQDFQKFSQSFYGGKKSEEIDDLIIKDLNWLHISLAYFRVLKTAIFCHEVRETDFSQTKLSSDMPSKLRISDLKYSHFILLTPNARKEDVLATLKRYQDGFKDNASPYAYLAVPGFTSRAKTSLRKYRAWYWIDKNARNEFGDRLPMRKFQAVAKEISELEIPLRSNDESEIKKGIKFYKHLLGISRTR